MYKQQNPYGCGLYAVANACNLPESFITPERLESSKVPGSSNGSLSRLLQEDGYNLFMQPLFYDGNATMLPDAHTEYFVSGDASAMPLVLCVILSEGGKSHMVGAHLDVNGTLHVYDSLRVEPLITALNQLHCHYHKVFGLYAFCDLETGAYAFI